MGPLSDLLRGSSRAVTASTSPTPVGLEFAVRASSVKPITSRNGPAPPRSAGFWLAPKCLQSDQHLVQRQSRPALVEAGRERPFPLVGVEQLVRQSAAEHEGQVQLPVDVADGRIDHPATVDDVAEPQVAVGEGGRRVPRQQVGQRAVARPTEPVGNLLPAPRDRPGGPGSGCRTKNVGQSSHQVFCWSNRPAGLSRCQPNRGRRRAVHQGERRGRARPSPASPLHVLQHQHVLAGGDHLRAPARRQRASASSPSASTSAGYGQRLTTTSRPSASRCRVVVQISPPLRGRRGHRGRQFRRPVRDSGAGSSQRDDDGGGDPGVMGHRDPPARDARDPRPPWRPCR